MGRFLPLFSISVTHEFYGADAAPDLRFVPSVATATIIQNENLIVRKTATGLEIWQEQYEDRELPAGALQLIFDIFSDDPLLRFYTEWPVAVPLRYKNINSPASATGQLLQVVLPDVALTRPDQGERNNQSKVTNQMKQAVFSVEIELAVANFVGDGTDGGQQMPSYVLALKSKKIHWKYFFSGVLAAKKLRIVDLDASDKVEGVRFAPSALTATDAGTAYLSESALPMQRLPQQRLQLREEGSAGKVLIRRLPNASIEKLGKERGPNGQSMIVAEIYIHQ